MSNYAECDFHFCRQREARVAVLEYTPSFATTENEPQERAAKTEVITGHAAVFYDPGDPGTEFQLFRDVTERIARTAFDGALKRPDDVRALFNHDEDHLLGRSSNGSLDLALDGKGLRFAIRYDGSDPDHKRVRAKIMRGDLTGASFGFVAEKETFEDEGGMIVRTLEAVNPLIDVGPVTFPAFTATDAVLSRRKHELVQKSLACYIGQHRDDSGVRQLETRAAKLFGWELPPEVQPGKPVEWYRKRLELQGRKIRLRELA